MSTRGRPVGCGHESVVYVWPQKWKASASPGLTAPPAAAATTAPPTRARNPRRDVERSTKRLTSNMRASSLFCGGDQGDACGADYQDGRALPARPSEPTGRHAR